jgi:hypothetical protein
MAFYTEAMQYMSRPNKRPKAVTYGGTSAGIIGGVLMLLFLMVANVFLQGDFFLPVRMIAASLMGVEAQTGGAAPILLGLVLHLVVSSLLGIFFAFVATPVKSLANYLGFGILYGFALWVVMTYMGLPILNPILGESIQYMTYQWFFAHLIFGASLGLIPFFEYQKESKGELK